MAQKYTQKETQYNETKEPKAKPRRELKIQFGYSLGINFVLAFIGRKLIPRNMMHTYIVANYSPWILILINATYAKPPTQH